MSYNGKWGLFDENARQPPQTNREKYARDKSTSQEVLQDLPLLFNRPGVIEDQFVHAFAAARTSYNKANSNQQPPIWTSFAFQIHLDILYSTEVGAGWTPMCNEVNTLQRYVDSYPNASSNMKELMRSVGKIMEADPVALLRQALDLPYTLRLMDPTRAYHLS